MHLWRKKKLQFQAIQKYLQALTTIYICSLCYILIFLRYNVKKQKKIQLSNMHETKWLPYSFIKVHMFLLNTPYIIKHAFLNNASCREHTWLIIFNYRIKVAVFHYGPIQFSLLDIYKVGICQRVKLCTFSIFDCQW